MEEQVSHISDLEGLNSELEGFLSELHGREEALSARGKILEAELSGARAAAAAAMAGIAQKEASLSSALKELRGESSRVSALASERESLVRQLEALSSRLEDARAGLADKDSLLQEAREAAKIKVAELSAVINRQSASLEDESSKVSSMMSERKDLLLQLEASASALEEGKAASLKQDALLNESRASAREKAAELSAVIDQVKTSLLDENSKVQALISERDGLLLRLEAAARGLEGEKNRSAEKELLLNGARSALKDKEGELGRVLCDVEELKAGLSLERANVKDREAQLQKILKQKEGFERRLEQAAQENSRSEEGFLLKIELVKKELREQEKRTGDIERKLAAAGARLDETLDELGKKEKILAAADSALAEKDARLKAVNLELKALAKEFSEVKNGSGHENVQRATELAASMAARVEELEAELAETSARSLEKFRALQAELSSVKAALRGKEEENAALQGREGSLSGELAEAEEKWKFASAQLHNAVSRLRSSENENEIALGRLKSVEEERNKFRAAAMKAEAAASAMAVQKSRAQDGEAAGLVAALEEQAAEYTVLLRKYDDIVLLNETLAREKAGVNAEAASLRSRLQEAAVSAAGEAEAEKARYAALSEKMHKADALLKKKEFELDEARDALKTAQETAEAVTGAKRGQQSGLAGKLRGAEALLKKKEFELDKARAAAASAGDEAALLRARLQEAAASAAVEAEAEKARYAALSEKMHQAGTLLKKKEFELDEVRDALSALENECSMLRQSRSALEGKYALEIHAENEMLKEAAARVGEKDSLITRLAVTEEELKAETEALRKEKPDLGSPSRSSVVSEAERLLAEKESRLLALRAELEKTREEKAGLQGREKELREELKSRPYRALLREAEDKLVIKEKMLAEVNSRMKKVGKDFEELKGRGQSSDTPGYIPDFEELVAGVAHQVANSISIIRSHAEFCAEAPEAEGAKESLGVIVRNIVNLQKKIDIIMNFSRPVIPQRSPERLAAVLSEVIDGLRASGRLENIKVSLKGGDKLKTVSLDRVRFASAAEQLLVNAAEAMPGGGELSVVLSGAGGRQRLEVADTGAGVEKKNLGAVFHPFFTTRPGKMGLGLTLARNVARAHGGTLELFNGPGKGARAVLELPEA